MDSKWSGIIRSIYLYVVSIIALVMIVIAATGMIRLVLNEYVFEVKDWDYRWDCENVESPEDCDEIIAEKNEMAHANDVKRDWVEFISMMLVAVPLFAYHWGVIRRESKKK